jgi:hypothetical protein
MWNSGEDAARDIDWQLTHLPAPYSEMTGAFEQNHLFFFGTKPLTDCSDEEKSRSGNFVSYASGKLVQDPLSAPPPTYGTTTEASTGR